MHCLIMMVAARVGLPRVDEAEIYLTAVIVLDSTLQPSTTSTRPPHTSADARLGIVWMDACRKSMTGMHEAQQNEIN